MKRLLPLLALLLAGCSGVTSQGNYFSDSKGSLSLYAGTPCITGAQWPAGGQFLPPNPPQYGAILKISDGAPPVALGHVWCAWGYEDSLNFNNQVLSWVIDGDFGLSTAPGLRLVTIKGGSSYITVSGVLHGHGTSEDVKLGDWSDQSFSYSSHLDLSRLTEIDGSKVQVVIGHARHVTLGPQDHVQLWNSFWLDAYWWTKRVYWYIEGKGPQPP